MALLEICKITIPAAGGSGASTYYFQTKKNVYKGDIANATGVEPAPTTFNNDEPIIPIGQLILSNKLKREYAECESGGKKKLVEILVRRDKVEEATAPAGTLEGKIFGSYGTIKAIRSKQKDSYR